jgi:hypothetical protein
LHPPAHLLLLHEDLAVDAEEALQGGAGEDAEAEVAEDVGPHEDRHQLRPIALFLSL